jgi:outer membrane protein assembly factor BamB
MRVAAIFAALLVAPVAGQRVWPGDFPGLAPPSVPAVAPRSAPSLVAALELPAGSNFEAWTPATDSSGAIFTFRNTVGGDVFRPSPGGWAKARWDDAVRAGDYAMPPVLSRDASVLLYGGGQRGLVATNSSTGQVLWSYVAAMGTSSHLGNSIHVPHKVTFSADGETAYLSAHGPAWWGRCWCATTIFFSEIGSVHAVRIADGAKLWSYNTPWPCAPFGPHNSNAGCDMPSNWPEQTGGQPLGTTLIGSTLFVALTSIQYRGINGNPPGAWPASFAAGGRTGSLLGLNAATGQLLWRTALPTGATGPVLRRPGDSSVVLVPGGNVLYTLFITDGAHKWEYIFDHHVIQFVVTTEIVYVVTGETRLHALRANDGAFLWAVTLIGSSLGGLPYDPLVVTSDGLLIGVVSDRAYALDVSRNGSTLWTIDPPGVSRFTAAAAIDSRGNLLLPTSAGIYFVYSSCPPGHFCPTPDVTARCPAGTFSAGDARACTPCPRNTFAASNGLISASNCTACPPGTASAEGAVACERVVDVVGSQPAPSCTLRRFPSADVAGDRLSATTVPTEDDCASACCRLEACMGFAFCRLSGVSPSCTLLANVSHVIPSSIMASGVRTAVLGL